MPIDLHPSHATFQSHVDAQFVPYSRGIPRSADEDRFPEGDPGEETVAAPSRSSAPIEAQPRVPSVSVQGNLVPSVEEDGFW